MPLVLSARDARRGMIVAAVNLAGRHAGIRPTMRLSEATALVDADVREHDPHEDIEALCSLAEQAQQFSPLVGLEQLDKKLWAGRTLLQPECLLLDVAGIAGLFGGEEALLEKVCQWLSEQRYFGCLGLASSVGAAWALANYQTRCLKRGQASFPQKRPAPFSPGENNYRSYARQSVDGPPLNLPPSGDGNYTPDCRACRAPLGQDSAAMAALPLAALRLQPETIVSLQRLGLRTIGQLSELPRAGLATRLGEQLLLRWDQATGRKREPIVTLHSSPDWSLQQTLEYPTQHRETIAELLRRLSCDLAERLSRRGEGALRIVCRLELVESPPLVMQLGLFRPSSDASHLQMLLTGQLEQELRSQAASGQTPQLWRLSLQATLTAPIVWRQVDLFDAGETVSRQQVARLVDTLSSRLGRKQVLSAQVRREAQPELACTLQPMTGRRQDGQEQETVRKLSSRMARQRGEPSRQDPGRRPTQLFSPAIQIQVAMQETQAASPALAASPGRFRYQGAWLDIIASTGPERLESGWWRGPSARRDYYRVTTSQDGWWWLYRDLNTGKWFLHGAFD